MTPEALGPLVAELLHAGLRPTLTLRDGRLAFEVPGFYQSGSVLLYQDAAGNWLACDRDRDAHCRSRVDSLADLARLNLYWWQASAENSPGRWDAPDATWLPLLVRYGLVEVREQVVRTYHATRR